MSVQLQASQGILSAKYVKNNKKRENNNTEADKKKWYENNTLLVYNAEANNITHSQKNTTFMILRCSNVTWVLL